MSLSLLVTGGAGYIGTHTLVELIAAGFRPVVFDNLSNSSRQSLDRVARITGVAVPFVEGDLRTPGAVAAVLAAWARAGDPIQAVLHLAGCKAVGESVADPLKYYDNNVIGTQQLLHAMRDHGIKRLVFSSSATVYGVPQHLPLREDHPMVPNNPYGRTKAMVEDMLADLCAADPEFGAVTLRYFNPIGAHASGLIGENPADTPNNLFPYITQVAVGRRAQLSVFGDDYDTVDGTGVRDYLHVTDLARGHVAAANYVHAQPGFTAINLGTGQGTSVLELIAAFESSTGVAIPWLGSPRRAGDVAASFADSSKAQALLGWSAERSVADMCRDGWHWQQGNPQGYDTVASAHAREDVAVVAV